MSTRRFIATTLLLVFMFMLGLSCVFFMTGIPASDAVHRAICAGYERGVTDSARETGEYLIWTCG